MQPRREVVLAALGGTALTLLLKLPVLRGAGESVPGDVGDPMLLTYLLAWSGEAVTTADPFDTNTFTPLPRSLAFSDALLGYAPFGLVGDGPQDALVRYAVVFLFAYALAFLGTYVLARQLGASPLAAAVAGAAFAFSPFRLAQSGHLQVLSSGGIPLALALLLRGHGVPRGRPRPGLALAGWAVGAWQVSLGFGLGLMTAYLLALAALAWAVGQLVRRVRPPRRLLLADLAGGLAFAAVGLVLAVPYLQVVEEHPQARRDATTVAFYSPPARALLVAPPESRLWGERTAERRESLTFPAEHALLPGAVVTGLAALGLASRRAPRTTRVLLAGSTVVLAVFALGLAGPAGGRFTYLPLLEHAPGWQGVRTPGRLVTLAWLFLAVLAALGVDLLRRLARRGAPVVAVGLLAAVLVESADRLPQATPRPPPQVELADLPQPLLVLPTSEIADLTTMWWTTDGFPDVVNGHSGFVPRRTAETREAAVGFPGPESVAALRRLGVASVLVVPDQLPGTPYEGVLDAPRPADLRVTAYADAVAYDLR